MLLYVLHYYRLCVTYSRLPVVYHNITDEYTPYIQFYLLYICISEPQKSPSSVIAGASAAMNRYRIVETDFWKFLENRDSSRFRGLGFRA